RLPADISGSLQCGYYDITPAANARAANRVVTLTSDQVSYWKGVDVNVMVRAAGTLRFQGGTSTGRTVTDTCSVLVDNPSPRGCHVEAPFQTNVRAVGSYVVPKIGVNVSGVYQYKPGVPLAATYFLSAADGTLQAVTAQLGRAPTLGGATAVQLLLP